MKQPFLLAWAIFAGLTIGASLSASAQGPALFDDFSGPLDPAWVEFGSSGRVFTDQGRMVMDYRQDLTPKPGVRRNFLPQSGKIYTSFIVNSERNWLTAYVNFINTNQDTVVQLVIDNGNGNGFLVADSLLPDGTPASLTKVSDGFAKNQDYSVSIALDLGTQTYSVSVDGVLLPQGTAIPVLENSTDFSTIEIFQQYMFNNGTDTTAQNLYFDDFLISDTDKSILASTIAEATDLANQANIGSNPGQIPQAALTNLSDSILVAQAIFNDPNADQAAVDLAVANLRMAINAFLAAVIPVNLSFDIDPANGNDIEEGMSGFNVRIIDNTYTYTHPEFQKAVDTLNTGWLRYFSGTTGDAFNARTGFFELEWADQMVKEGETNNPNQGFFRHYKLSDAKGAYRLHDLYTLLGRNEARLIITFNAFTDSPEGLAALAKFCADNHIIVEDWQLCNEPYFFVPGRGHYFFQNGRDYATRMKVMADSIRANYPGAMVSLNYSWDAMDGFASGNNGIKSYQNPYWDILGKHSYAAFGQNDDFARALTRMNGGLAYLTEESMQDIYKTDWPTDAPVHVTEWNTFNNQLSGTYMNAMYAGEYLLRMLDHEQVRFLGHHRLSSTAGPRINRAGMIEAAYDGGFAIEPDTILEGLAFSPNGPIFRLFNEAINQSTFRYASSIGGSQILLSANNQNGSATDVEAMYAQAFKGNYGYDFALFTNKSELPHSLVMQINGSPITDTLFLTWLVPPGDISGGGVPVPMTDTVVNGVVRIPAYGMMQVKWKTTPIAPQATRIYQAEVLDDAVQLSYWPRDNAEEYTIRYGTDSSNLNQTLIVLGQQFTVMTVSGLSPGQTWYFEVTAENAQGVSPASNMVAVMVDQPEAPVLAHLHPRNRRINAEWWSVPAATGYQLWYGSSSGTYTDTLDVGNITGARIRDAVEGQTYYCVVVAYNGEGMSPPSNEMSVTYAAGIPFAPVNVKASESLNDGSVLVQWTVSDSAYGGFHRLYRSTEAYGSWTLVADSLTGTSHTDLSPSAAGSTYYYSLKSVNDAGDSYYFSQAAVVEKQISTSLDDALGNHRYHPWQADLDQYFREYGIEIYDMSGRIVLKADSHQVLHNWQRSSQAAHGIYIWKLDGELLSSTPYQASGKFQN